jgi:hypothetical protein
MMSEAFVDPCDFLVLVATDETIAVQIEVGYAFKVAVGKTTSYH